MTTTISLKDQVIKAFTDLNIPRHVFTPEIKVKRKNDTLYISELRKTQVSIQAMVEVGASGDKAPIPLGMLDERTLGAIVQRLK